MNIFRNKTILVCGGTGSIGSEIVKQLLTYKPKQVRVLARDETKQQELVQSLGFPLNLRSLIGDIRDKDRLNFAMDGVNIVFNAAALKAVPYCEYNPFEAVLTNVIGTQNIIEMALRHNVQRVVTISTDKAAEPINTLGATKLLSERITAAADYFRGKRPIKFSAVRFGNVLGSRNSLLPILKDQILKGQQVSITDPKMTRFIMTIPDAVKLVFQAATISHGGEVFVLKMPTVFIGDLIEVFIDEVCKKNNIIQKKVVTKTIGLRPGEKTHENLLNTTESSYTYENHELYMVLSNISKPNETAQLKRYQGFHRLKSQIEYNSENTKKLTRDEIRAIIRKGNFA